MFTLCIRYTINPDRLADFESYAKTLPAIVERCGGRFISYYLPTKFAGPNDTAYGLIDFPTLGAYEEYRGKLAADPAGVEAARRGEQSGCITREERSFLRRAVDR